MCFHVMRTTMTTSTTGAVIHKGAFLIYLHRVALIMQPTTVKWSQVLLLLLLVCVFVCYYVCVYERKGVIAPCRVVS